MGRPRGRPRQYEPEEALEAAMTVFWERGFSAPSLEDLSEATGMNRPSLYAAFGDKRSMYLRSLQRFADRMAAAAERLGEPDLERALTSFYFEAIDVYVPARHRARGCMVVTTAATEATNDDAVQEQLAKSVVALDAALGGRFRKAADEGCVGRQDADALGRLATAILHSLSVRARAGASRRELRKMAREGAAILGARRAPGSARVP